MFNSCIVRTSSASSSLIRSGNRFGVFKSFGVPRFALSSSSSAGGPGSNELQSQKEVEEFLSQLSDSQKQLLLNSLRLEALRRRYHNELGQYLSKFGRPSAHPAGTEDPTGTLCEVPPEWLQNRIAPSELLVPKDPPLDESIRSPPPTGSDIYAVALKNCLPFVGFGFLDNLIMILAGDYIDIKIGTALGISTMAAAALGNTISDVAGIASAWYIEMFAEKIGIKEPKLTAFQLKSWQIRWATNAGRAVGVVIGCLLGMIPLMFLPTSAEKKERAAAKFKSENDEQ